MDKKASDQKGQRDYRQIGRLLLRFYREYLSRHKGDFVGCCLLLLFFSILLISPPFMISLLIDKAISSKDLGLVFAFAGGIFAVFALVAVVDKGQGVLGLRLSQRVARDLRKDLHSHLQKLTFSFYDNTKTGELLSRIIDDLNVVERSLYQFPRMLIENAVTVLMALGFSIYLTWECVELALICFAVLPGIFVVFVVFSRRILGQSRKVRHHKATLASRTEDNISGMRIVQAFGQEDYERSRFDKENRDHYLSRLGVIANQTWMFLFALLLVGLSLAIAAGYGGYQVLEGPLQVGALAGFMMYLQRFMGPLRALANITDPAARLIAGIERFFQYMDIEPEIDDNRDAIDMGRAQGEISFRDVWFRYENEDILKGIDFHVASGQTVALVGPSGSGKSTVTRLIPRFYEPYSGNIYLDGRKLQDYSLRSLRANIGIVMQEQHLISDTLANNIAYGRDDASFEDIVEAARKANVDHFVPDLSDGYDTEVGQRGTKLSEGQGQRVAIARAILKDAPILILDEATSSVDSQTEQLIQQALDTLLEDKTAFIVAHRLSTILHADKILFIENGEIAEAGTHTELLEQNNKYAKFYNLQFRAGQG